MSSEPPEEPYHRNEPSILSPASPKPIHFPGPSNITVLEMQHDEGFNQTEPHMNDPALRNTELRPNLWRDPNELTEEQAALPAALEKEGVATTDMAVDHVTPNSTGAGDTTMTEHETDGSSEAKPAADQQEAHSVDTAGTINTSADATQTSPPDLEAHIKPAQSSGTPHDSANGGASTNHAGHALQDPSSDPSVPTADPISTPVAQDAVLHAESDAHPSAAAAPAFNPVDVQALLDTLQTAPSAAAHTNPLLDSLAQAPSAAHQAPPGTSMSSPTPAQAAGVATIGLPPRPPPQEQPLIHPNYVHSQHIRDYHPHAANPAFQPHGKPGSQGNSADPSSKNFVPPIPSPTSTSAAIPAAQQQSPTPYSAANPSFANNHTGQGPQASYTPYIESPATSNFGAYTANSAPGYSASTSTPIETRREWNARPEDRPWDAEVQRKYDRFIEEERNYVSEGRWEQFPNGARLFVGNLSSEKVTKRDIFHVFHTYGELAQISIKQAYGFVQFLRAEDCAAAMNAEQGTQIRDKRIHLEVSKPQKSRPQPNTRRSRSPQDHVRGRPGSNVDRYVSGSRGGNNNGNRRDGYRPGHRSPSPRGYRDRYDDRYRARSRSPAYGRGGGRDRYRSPSPRRDVDDDLPLPKRRGSDVPEVQIIVLDSLDRDFISWVEQAFTSRSVRADVLLLSSRLSEQAVVRRQIVEGVLAVVKLTRQNQQTAKIGLQIFDRRNGASNVSFEEYDGLDPPIAVELVLRAKNTHHAPAAQPSYVGYGGQQQSYNNYPSQGYNASQQPNYSQPSYPPHYQQPPQPPVPPQSVPPHLQNLITNLDPNNLQTLLSAMNTPQSAAGSAYSGGTPAAAVQALQNNPGLASYLQQQQQQPQVQPQAQPQQAASSSGQQVNMQDILARLGSGNYPR